MNDMWDAEMGDPKWAQCVNHYGIKVTSETCYNAVTANLLLSRI